MVVSEEKQVRASVANTFDTNYLVEAGAGAGKSTLIVERIINQILHDSIKVSEIVAITFTEKAANELQYKFQKKLRQRIQAETDATAKAKLQAALNDIDRMFMSTVHAFCSKLLGEMPFHAGLTIGFKPMDEQENVAFKNHIWERFITRKHDEKTLEKINKLRAEEIAPHELKNFFMEVCEAKSLGNEMDYDPRFPNPYPKLVECLERLHKFIAPIDQADLKKGSFNDYPNLLLDEIFSGEPRNAKELTLSFAKSLCKLPSLVDVFKKKAIKDNEELEEVLTLFDLDEFKELYNQYKEYIYHISVDFIAGAHQLYETEKKRQMRVSFNDLLFKTYEMLKDSPEARAFFGKKYQCIYVDEFQDTDPLQTKILFFLTAANQDHNGDWLKCKPRRGSLFFVGDPKQSIYRFRQADISIYDKVKKLVNELDGWEAVSLKWNFRTNPEICEWVEKRFMIDPETGEDEDDLTKNGAERFYYATEEKSYQTIFHGMESQTARALEDDSVLNGVYQYDLGDGKASEMIEMDATLIADWIKHQVGSGSIYHYDHAEKVNVKRKIRYGDFLILLKTTKGMSTYIDEMKKRGIPVSFAGKINLYEMHEPANLIDVISYLNDHRNMIKLAGLLQNGFGIVLPSIDMKELSEIVGSDYFSAMNQVLFNEEKWNALKHEPLKGALLKLKTYIGWKQQYDPITVVEKIIHDYESILKESYDHINFRSAVGTLYYMLELVKKEEYTSFYALAEKFEAMKELSIDREMPIEYDVDDNGEYNSVRIMNLHKAKGLEGNIVILAKPCGDKKHPPFKHIERKDGVDFAHLCVKNDYDKVLGAPRGWDEKEAEENRFKAAEDLRLLYVAATRAAKTLVISKGKARNSPSPWADLFNVSKEHEPVDLPGWNEVAAVEVSGDSGEEELVEKVERLKKQLLEKQDSIKQLSKPSYFLVNPSMLEKDKSLKLEDEGMSALLEDDFSEVELDKPADPNPYGPTLGTMIHRMFELAINKNMVAGELQEKERKLVIKRAIIETLEQTILTEKVLKQLNASEVSLHQPSHVVNRELARQLTPELTKTLEQFENHAEMKMLLSTADQVITEMPFYIVLDGARDKEIYEYVKSHIGGKQSDLKIEESNTHTIRVSGIIDLVIRNGNSYQIIDYKTNQKSSGLREYLLKHYESQLLAYRQILEKITASQVERVMIYSTELDELIDLVG